MTYFDLVAAGRLKVVVFLAKKTGKRSGRGWDKVESTIHWRTSVKFSSLLSNDCSIFSADGFSSS